MAQSKCPRCEHSTFEMKDAAPSGGNFKVTFVQCGSCGTVVGVMDSVNVPVLIEKLAQKLGVRNLSR